MINFTKENLSKIHISQFERFLRNHNVRHLKDNNFISVGSLYNRFYHNILITLKKDSGYLYWADVNNSYFTDINQLLTELYPKYVQGDLTQFHVLFTQVYNEIMSYPINETGDKTVVTN
jgi:hypothetical protein